jgi:Rrf2 family protein
VFLVYNTKNKRDYMQLHTTSKYAIRIMSYMANNSEKLLFNAREISEVLTIPYKFMTKIMSDLVKANLIVSVRGREGGYKIAKPASSIAIIDIINTFNEFTHQDECLLGIGKCDGDSICSMHEQWSEPKSLIQKMFENTTLQNLEGGNFKV